MKQQSLYALGICGLTAIILTCLPVASDTVQDTEAVTSPVVETIILPAPTPDTTPTSEPEYTTDLRPFGWDEVNEAFSTEEYFPDFTLEETTIEDAPYYKLSLQNSDIYLLVDEWQQYMTVFNGADSVTVDIWYLTPSTGPHVSITVQDVTEDGQDDLVYLSSDGGFGMATAVCRIVDLTTLEVYEIEPFAQALGKQLTVTPLDTTTDPQQLRMALTLGETAPVYGYAYLEAGTNTEDVKVNSLTDEAGYHTIFWSSYKTHLMGSVGITTNHDCPGQLMATVTGVLHFNPNTNRFQIGEPYFLGGELYDTPEELSTTTTATPLDDTLTTTEIAPPEITEVKKVIYTQMADVTHDGIDDVIETSITLPSDVQDTSLEALLKMTLHCDIAVYDTTLSTSNPIYQQSYGAPHTANGQLSLVTADDLFYLLEGSLYAGQGYYTFAHSLFSLDSQGNRQVQAEDSAEGQLSDGDAASKIQAYFSNLTPWIESATAIAILDINLENQMVRTQDETYLAKDYYQAMSAYYSEMTDEYALLG